MELWSTLWFNENMEISSYGRLRNKRTGRIWKLLKHKRGYPQVSIYSTITKTARPVKIHRLVAEAFIPKIEGKDQVNHKDFDKQNNNVSNLEWCTMQENIDHYREKAFAPLITNEQVLYIRQNIETLGVKKLAKELNILGGYIMNVANGTYFPDIHKEYIRNKKPSLPKCILQYTKNGVLIKEHSSLQSAAKELNTRISAIQRTLRGHRNAHKGFIFKYKDEINNPTDESIPQKSKKIKGTGISQYGVNGNYMETYKTASEAARIVGCDAKSIRKCLYGEQKTTAGFIWKYAD